MNGLKELIGQFSAKPQRLLLIDSIGAAVTVALLLGVVKTNPLLFGVPPTIINYLSAIAVVFCLYSLTSYFAPNNKHKLLLKIISVANATYAIITWVTLGYNLAGITTLGVIYFLSESAIILTLVYIEFNVAKSISRADAWKSNNQ
ncbi:MAG: hypothetical protein F9K23_03835 [Bacteroidetes bacterium]|nr:MAG: hypothetical protein F9K23_03835 [Bacteroidota bacterium]